MVTTTTSPWSANFVPSYHGVSPAPQMNAPPWIHTSTGRRSSSHPGVHTLRYSESSLYAGRDSPIIVAIANSVWADWAENSVASRTPSHDSSRCGARHRRAPTGGVA